MAPVARNVILPRCNFCKSSEAPASLCSSCKVVRYCNREHQTLDWALHKPPCTKVRQARARLEKEEIQLRNAPSSPFFAANPFKNSVGHFWGILETRDYMRARIDLVITVLKYFDTYEAASTSLDHLLDMLRLCRSDNLGVRDMVPNLYLRLHLDQKCYDFLKWYATEGQNYEYDWGDMSLGFLNLENQDAMESPTELFCGSWRGMTAHAIPALLIKLRILLDLKDVLGSFTLFNVDKLNFDTVRKIQDSLPLGSSVLSARKVELLEREGLEERIKLLEQQADEIYESIHKRNKHFWSALMAWERWMDTEVEQYSAGTKEEMVILLLNNAKSWVETVGALEWVKEKLQRP